MIPIAMKSKGATDLNSILSINQARTQSALCAQNITTLNKPPRRTGGFPAASASTCRDCNPRRSTNRGAA